MIDTVIHKWLRVPYSLNIGVDTKPKGKHKATVVFIHGLASSHIMWDKTIKSINLKNVRLMTVDLLGFGGSPKPIWQTYDAKTHARALRMTMLRANVRGPVILVGHSLGSLVAVQYASMYPKHVAELLLCSPPLYRASKLIEKASILSFSGMITQADDALRVAYKYARDNPDMSRRIAEIVGNAKLVNPGFSVTDETLPAIVGSLEMSIENQTAMLDAMKLSIPINIIYGTLDPFIVRRNLRDLENSSSYIKSEAVIAGHEIGVTGAYRRRLVSRIKSIVENVIDT